MEMQFVRCFFHFLVVNFLVNSSKSTKGIGTQGLRIRLHIFRTQEMIEYTEETINEGKKVFEKTLEEDVGWREASNERNLKHSILLQSSGLQHQLQ